MLAIEECPLHLCSYRYLMVTLATTFLVQFVLFGCDNALEARPPRRSCTTVDGGVTPFTELNSPLLRLSQHIICAIQLMVVTVGTQQLANSV